ncbi:MAG: lactate dehydrogenase [Gammaproteobacteria bacterium]|nr:lactate dehydrogenase [Gammaproteobacteria bacterium]
MFLTTSSNLKDFISRCLSSCSISNKESKIISDLMTEADLRGADGHGIFRLPQYVKRIRAGGININPNINIAKDHASTALVDGDNGMGHLVMQYASDLAVKKALNTGIGWVGANNSNHAGPASLYASIPMSSDMIGIYIAVGSANHLPPWGGIDMLLSTNPIAIAIPALNEKPIILDMATTVAAYGKVKMAAEKGESIPEGWMIDKSGYPITDPKKSSEGFLLPIGDYKGYGLSLVFGILAGTLNNAALGKDVINFNSDFITPTNTGQLVIAISIDRFTEINIFKRNIDSIIRSMKGSATLPGIDEIRLPGEGSWKIRENRKKNGIPIHLDLKKKLDKLAKELKVLPLLSI